MCHNVSGRLGITVNIFGLVSFTLPYFCMVMKLTIVFQSLQRLNSPFHSWSGTHVVNKLNYLTSFIEVVMLISSLMKQFKQDRKTNYDVALDELNKNSI